LGFGAARARIFHRGAVLIHFHHFSGRFRVVIAGRPWQWRGKGHTHLTFGDRGKRKLQEAVGLDGGANVGPVPWEKL